MSRKDLLACIASYAITIVGFPGVLMGAAYVQRLLA